MKNLAAVRIEKKLDLLLWIQMTAMELGGSFMGKQIFEEAALKLKEINDGN